MTGNDPEGVDTHYNSPLQCNHNVITAFMLIQFQVDNS